MYNCKSETNAQKGYNKDIWRAESKGTWPRGLGKAFLHWDDKALQTEGNVWMLWGGRECGMFKKWKMAQGMMTAGIQGPDHSSSN